MKNRLNPGGTLVATTQVFIPPGSLPHTVCPVFADAVGPDDAHTHGARLQVMPEVAMELLPNTTIVARGDALTLTAVVRNNAAPNQIRDGWTEVILSDHKPYPGNPVVGPQTVFLGPYAERTKVLGHVIPNSAPTGSYVYIGCVGDFESGEISDQDSFGFQIIE